MNEIICGDAIEEVANLEDNSIDLLLTDPPYNIATDFEVGREDEGGAYAGANISHDFGEWDKQNLTVDDWLPLFSPTLKENAVVCVFYDYTEIGSLISVMEDMDMKIRQPIVFRKKNPPPQGFKVKWMDAVELGYIATMNEGAGHHYQPDQGQRHNVITTPLCSGNERYEHPTQKPEALIEPIIEWWTEESDTVLDPFCGTGTIPYVAAKYGRNFIGIEQDEKYADLSKNRVETTTRSQSALEW